MKTQLGHTQTPWHVRTKDIEGEIWSEDHKFICVASHTANGLEDAAFIVRAVNAHEDLLSIAKAYLEFMSADPSMPKEQKRFVKQAIAKAEGSL